MYYLDVVRDQRVFSRHLINKIEVKKSNILSIKWVSIT